MKLLDATKSKSIKPFTSWHIFKRKSMPFRKKMLRFQDNTSGYSSNLKS